MWKKAKWNSEKIWEIQKKGKLNSEIMWKIWKKSKLNSEKTWQIQRKSKLNSEKIGKWVVVVVVVVVNFVRNVIIEIYNKMARKGQITSERASS